MIKKLIWKILKSNKKLQQSILDQYINEDLITERQKSVIVSGMKLDKVVDRECLDNKTLILYNCLFINSTLSNNIIHGDMKSPYNCIISNNTYLKEDVEPIEIPEFIKTKR